MSNSNMMNNEVNQTRKNRCLMLEIKDILLKKTLAETPLTADEICTLLKENGIRSSHRIVSATIDALQQYDQDLKIEITMKGKKKAYYCANHLFELGEIIFLIATIRSFKSISDDEAEKLIQKLISCTSEYERKDVIEKIPFKFSKKHNNGHVMEYIGRIGCAISQKKQVIFYYYDLGPYQERKYHHEGKKYQISPLSVSADNDHLYMIGYDHEVHDVRIYRLDRMDFLKISDFGWHEEAEAALPRVIESLGQMIEMFGGDKKQMIIEFDEGKVHLLRNLFGDEIKPRNAGDGRLKLTVCVREGPPLFGKIFGLDADAEIIFPKELRSHYVERLVKECKQYNLQLVKVGE